MAFLGNFAAGRKPDQLTPTASIFGEKIISVLFEVRVRFSLILFSVTI